MMMTRRYCLALGLASLAASAQAQDRGLPAPVRQAMRQYRGSEVVSVRIRHGAPTAQGFMYEVTLAGRGGERIVYVDPDDGRVLFETEAVGR